jgi:membrane-bound ClpP family serine protease
MLTLYLVAAMVGLGLIGYSVLTGGHHDGLDHDVSGHHGDDLGIGPFLSLRFWTYFAAAFGLSGAALSITQPKSSSSNFLWSLVAGFALGLIVHAIMRAVWRSESTSAAHVEDLIGKEGTLLVAPKDGQPGKVRLDVKGELIDMLALPYSGAVTETGSTVLIVAVEADRAIVARKEDLMDN